jgi:hypothetical protein
MRRWAMLMLFCAGCSTAPIADMKDYFWPGKLEQGKIPPYGGVCNPTPGVTGPAPIPVLPGVPSGPVLLPPAAVPPPPAAASSPAPVFPP